MIDKGHLCPFSVPVWWVEAALFVSSSNQSSMCHSNSTKAFVKKYAKIILSKYDSCVLVMFLWPLTFQGNAWQQRCCRSRHSSWKEQQAGAAACESPCGPQQHLGLPMAVLLWPAFVTAAWVQCPAMDLPTLLLAAKLGSSWEVWEAPILLLPNTVRESFLSTTLQDSLCLSEEALPYGSPLAAL